jgi:hypothetical protein
MILLRVQYSEDDCLFIKDLIENSMRQSAQVGAAPVTKTNAVAVGPLSDYVDHAVHFINEIVAQPGLRSSYQRASRSMSALASGCLLSAFIRQLPLEMIEVIGLERRGDGRIGLELGKPALQLSH